MPVYANYHQSEVTAKLLWTCGISMLPLTSANHLPLAGATEMPTSLAIKKTVKGFANCGYRESKLRIIFIPLQKIMFKTVAPRKMPEYSVQGLLELFLIYSIAGIGIKKNFLVYLSNITVAEAIPIISQPIRYVQNGVNQVNSFYIIPFYHLLNVDTFSGWSSLS